MQALYPRPLLGLSSPSSMPSLATCIGVTGLSLAATCFGAFKFVEIWKRVQQAKLRQIESRKKQEAELEFLQQSLIESQAEIEEKTKAMASYTEQIKRLAGRLSGVERELDDTKQENVALDGRTKQLSADNMQLGGELRHLKAEHYDTVTLLDARTAELKGAEAFLTKADQLAGADVIKLVEGLNSEIMQAAAIMAEGFVIEEKKVDDGAKEQESDEMRDAFARTEEVVGIHMAELLKTSEHHEDPILIQITFQAALAAYTHWIISSWCFENPDDEHMLSEIYARVRETEEQAVSGRWRQLTRTHLQRMLPNPPDLMTDMMDTITQMLITAGSKEKLAALHEQVVSRYSGRVRVVMDLAKRLNQVIGEGVTSCDLEALYIDADIVYNASTMDDGLNGPSARSTTPTPSGGSREKVLCTTDLGLVRAEKVSGKPGEWHESVLLKPKVILPSGIADITGDSS